MGSMMARLMCVLVFVGALLAAVFLQLLLRLLGQKIAPLPLGLLLVFITHDRATCSLFFAVLFQAAAWCRRRVLHVYVCAVSCCLPAQLVSWA